MTTLLTDDRASRFLNEVLTAPDQIDDVSCQPAEDVQPAERVVHAHGDFGHGDFGHADR